MWFSRNDKLTALTKEIERLTEEVAKLRGERNAISELKTLEEKVIDLKKQVVELEISRDKKKEDFDRRERELTHMIGLEKNRQKVEIEQAAQAAKLSVREENLAHERKEFEAQMKFRSDQFDGQVKYLQTLMGQILERLPTITVDREINERKGR